jgi:hypothetical protein
MRRRSAFTLVELLVSMALIIFIMALLSEAFVIGLQTFRDLKAIGDMDERLRAGTNEILSDLQADHFEGKRRLGDPNFWASGAPTQGFFRIYAPTTPMPFVAIGVAPSYIEGADGDGIQSAVVTDMVLHFSVKQRANRQERFFAATVPTGSPLLSLQTTIDASLGSGDARFQNPNNNSYSSPWAEVAYYLVANGEVAGLTPLYTLYRAQFVVAPDNSKLNWPPSPPPFPAPSPPSVVPTGYTEMSCEVSGAQIYFNSPSDLSLPPVDTLPAGTYPQRRAFDPTQPPVYDPNISPPLPRAATFVVGDVISFEIQVLTPGSSSFQYVTKNFDTATTPGGVISAIQITLRVWDKKTLQTRQITIVQDM